MDKAIQQQALTDTVGKRFRGRDTLQSKVTPRFPDGAEREYERISHEFMALYDKVLRAHMPELKRALHFYGGARFDDVPQTPDQIFNEVEQEVSKKLLSYDLRKRLERIANMNRKLTIAEWKRVCQRTLGVDIFEDYYKGDFFQQAMDTWVQDNVNLIITQPKDSLDRMREIVKQGYVEGQRPEAIAKEINEAYGMSKNHAKFVARDQVSKLNAQITQAQQQDAGVEEYTWSSSGDSRVRDCHRYLHGKKFRWDDPPEMWYHTKSRGRVNTGRHCHPGEDYQCRCVAIPVFNMEGIAEIPVSSVDWKSVDDRMKKVNE